MKFTLLSLFGIFLLSLLAWGIVRQTPDNSAASPLLSSGSIPTPLSPVTEPKPLQPQTPAPPISARPQYGAPNSDRTYTANNGSLISSTGPRPTGISGAYASRLSANNSAPTPSSLTASETTAPLADPETYLEIAIPPTIFPGQGEAIIPAALAQPAEITSLTPEQADAVNKLADEFIESLNQIDPNASDADYRDQWDEAQAISDIQFKTRYGSRAWMQYHLDAYHNSVAQ